MAIQFAFDLRKVTEGKLGFMNRPGSRSRLVREAIEAGHPLSLDGQGRAASEAVSMPVECFYEGMNDLGDHWSTLVLCTPADSYVDVIKTLPWERLTRVRSIVLMSPFLGAALLVEAALPADRKCDVVSLSSYFGDTKILDVNRPLAATTKAFKRRIFIAANRACPILDAVHQARMGAQPVNLLKFLNDDNYPVHEVMLDRNSIENFPDFEETHQEYLLFVRYSALLVDPFSRPDTLGRYFDFSAVPFRRAYLNAEQQWQIPRVPLEDYRKLSLIYQLGQYFDFPMPQTQTLLSNFDAAIQHFIKEKGADHCHSTVFQDHTPAQAETLYRQWLATSGKAGCC